MPTIDIIIRNKTASAVNPPCIVCGNSDYNVKFDFDDEWQAHNNKIGVFAYNRCGEWQSEKVLFEGDTCPVPALHGVRSVWIGVTAGDVRTSTPADVPCRMGATDFRAHPKSRQRIYGHKSSTSLTASVQAAARPTGRKTTQTARGILKTVAAVMTMCKQENLSYGLLIALRIQIPQGFTPVPRFFLRRREILYP